MPIPKPTTGETENAFMERCMGDDKMGAEHPDKDQRVAVCMTSFRDAKEQDMSDQQQDAIEYEEGKMDIEAEIKAVKDQDDEGGFEGYASVFGNADLGNDVVVEGAFAKSIARRGAKGVKMLYQHDAKQPIGVYDEITEDERGLRVKGRLALGTQRGREVYELMKMGAIDGLSIGYRVDAKGYDYDDKGKRRYLKSVDLMEISAVTFPMNPKARVQAVKSDRTIREWESFLRDEGGLSRNEAKAGAAALNKTLDQRDVGEESSELVAAMSAVTTLMKNGD
jgi:HK97 family phage prohead protease